ncbi:hypothetical protein [Burkholderia sp. WSM2232]|nr:hypothetical protein [Burkholderia sp. WSM2232]
MPTTCTPTSAPIDARRAAALIVSMAMVVISRAGGVASLNKESS